MEINVVRKRQFLFFDGKAMNFCKINGTFHDI